jgi:mono/diheme cytochrome c family protein
MCRDMTIGKRSTPSGVCRALALAALVAGLAATAVADERGIDDFPAGKGREETANYCAACHSGRIVSQQGMSRAQWDETLDVMTERHKMPKLEGEERAVILDYLAASFPPKKGRGAPNPFLKP